MSRPSSANVRKVSVNYVETTGTTGAHLVLVVDVSGSMIGEPLKAVVRETSRILKIMDKADSVTIWIFGDEGKKIKHFKVGQFNVETFDKLLQSEAGGYTRLYDTVIEAVGDLQAHAKGNRISHFFVVLSDGCDNHSRRNAADARRAMVACTVPNVHYILVSAGASQAFAGMKPPGSCDIDVGSTSNADLREAFQKVTNYMSAKLKVTVTQNGTTTTTMVSAHGANKNHVQASLQGQAAKLLGGAAVLAITGGSMSSKPAMITTRKPGTPACKFFLQGRCNKGSDCNFSHA